MLGIGIHPLVTSDGLDIDVIALFRVKVVENVLVAMFVAELVGFYFTIPFTINIHSEKLDKKMSFSLKDIKRSYY